MSGILHLKSGYRQELAILTCEVHPAHLNLNPEWLSACQEIIQKYHGVLKQNTATGFQAIFGLNESYPKTYCAIKCALELTEFYHQHQYQMTSGITIGFCHIKNKNNLEEITGEAIHFSELLSRQLNTSTIITSSEVYKRTKQWFQYSKIGKLQFRRLKKTLTIFKVTNLREFTYEHNIHPPLGGNQEEVNWLSNCFYSLKNKEHPHVIASLIGEHGIGKSRLIYELEKQLFEQHMFPFILRAATKHPLISPQLSEPFSFARQLLLNYLKPNQQAEEPWQLDENHDVLQLIRSHAGKHQAQSKSSIRRQLHQLLGIEPDYQLDEKAILRLLIAFVRGIAQQSQSIHSLPLLLILEDIDYVDPESIYLISEIVKHSLTMAPTFLIMTHQSHFELPENIVQHKSYTYMNLNALSLEESHKFIQNLPYQNKIPPNIKKDIIAKAEGKPAHLLTLSQSISRNKLVIPNQIREKLQNKINQLSFESIEWLQLAALITPKIPLKLWEQAIIKLHQQTKMPFKEWVQLPEIQSLLNFDKDQVHFQNPIIQELIETSIIKSNKPLLHHVIADAFCEVYEKTLHLHYSKIIYHYAMAANRGQTLKFLELAADDSVERKDYKQAIQLYEHVIEIAEDKEQNIRVLKKQVQLFKNQQLHDKALNQSLLIEKELEGIVKHHQVELSWNKVHHASILFEQQQYYWGLKLLDEAQKHAHLSLELQAEIGKMKEISESIQVNVNVKELQYTQQIQELIDTLPTKQFGPPEFWSILSELLLKMTQASHIKLGFLGSNELIFFSLNGQSQLQESGRVPPGAGICGWSIQTGIPQFVQNAKSQSRLNINVDSIDRQTPQSLIIYPVTQDEQVLCLLVLLQTKETFNTSDFYSTRYVSQLLSQKIDYLKDMKLSDFSSGLFQANLSTLQLLSSYVEKEFSGYLEFSLNSKSGKLYLNQGQASHAEIENSNLVGEEAFYEILLWNHETQCQGISDRYPAAVTIETETEELLSRGEALINEYELLIKNYTPDMIPNMSREVSFTGTFIQRALTPTKLIILQLIDESRALRDIQERVNENSHSFLNAIHELHSEGIIGFTSEI